MLGQLRWASARGRTGSGVIAALPARFSYIVMRSKMQGVLKYERELSNDLVLLQALLTTLTLKTALKDLKGNQ